MRTGKLGLHYLIMAGVMAFAVSGCTNVSSDATRFIHQPAVLHQNAEPMFAFAEGFFAAAGYQCRADQAVISLRCTRALRDLRVHQTTAVVRIFPGEDETGDFILTTTRWDEGLIPGEFISGEFSNPDVEMFCEYLKTQALGWCETVMEEV